MPDVARESLVPRRATILRGVGFLVLALVVGRAILELVGAVDWDEVVAALGHVSWWQIAVLAGLLVVRQVLNASPLSLFLTDLSLARATASDQATTLVSMVAPPPSDMVLRVAIFKSWGIATARGLAAATMNVLAFYINRFVVPLVGVLLLLPVRFDTGYATVALITTPIGLVLLGALVLAVRDESTAARTGTAAGRLVARVRPPSTPRRGASGRWSSAATSPAGSAAPSLVRCCTWS